MRQAKGSLLYDENWNDLLCGKIPSITGSHRQVNNTNRSQRASSGCAGQILNGVHSSTTFRKTRQVEKPNEGQAGFSEARGSSLARGKHMSDGVRKWQGTASFSCRFRPFPALFQKFASRTPSSANHCLCWRCEDSADLGSL
jgi:hypothetical protein